MGIDPGSGKGQIWFDSIRFEIVDKSVATTGKEESSEYEQEEPMNLDFDK